jgi:hypothetical protein
VVPKLRRTLALQFAAEEILEDWQVSDGVVRVNTITVVQRLVEIRSVLQVHVFANGFTPFGIPFTVLQVSISRNFY